MYEKARIWPLTQVVRDPPRKESGFHILGSFPVSGISLMPMSHILSLISIFNSLCILAKSLPLSGLQFPHLDNGGFCLMTLLRTTLLRASKVLHTFWQTGYASRIAPSHDTTVFLGHLGISLGHLNQRTQLSPHSSRETGQTHFNSESRVGTRQMHSIRHNSGLY